MDLFLYIMILIMGTVFGSFFTLAVYRIPLKKDITHERSFCTSCGHRLEFLDMIPVLSYIFIKGKCRYCGDKIRIRYLLLEVLSGLVFLLTYISLNIHFPYFDVQKILFFISFIFVYITLAITAGIDKEYKQVHLGVILFGIIMQTVCVLYTYMLEGNSNYVSLIYLMITLFALIINFIMSKKSSLKDEKIFNKSPYIFQIVLLSFYIMCFTGIKAFIEIGILTLVIIMIKNMLFKNKKEDKIPIGFFLSLSTIASVIVMNFMKFY